MKKEELDRFFDVDGEILDKMPTWFKRMREAYLKRSAFQADK